MRLHKGTKLALPPSRKASTLEICPSQKGNGKNYPGVRDQAGLPHPQPVSSRRNSQLKTWETWAFAILSVQASALFISWYGTLNPEIHRRTQRGTHRSKENIALEHMFQRPETALGTATEHFSKMCCRRAKTK